MMTPYAIADTEEPGFKSNYSAMGTKDGAIENLTLRVGSEEPTVDKQTHDLIANAAPLPIPPNDLVGAVKAAGIA